MIKYTEEFFKKKFTADTMKEAYLKACKWYASNVLAKDEMQNVLVDFIKSTEHLPTVTIHLSIGLGEKELREKNCEICREAHSHFFSTEETNCAWCKVSAYQKRTDDMLKVKLAYYRERIKR